MNKNIKGKLVKWYNKTDWAFVSMMIFAFAVISVVFGYAAYSIEKGKHISAEAKLRTEEFTYKGHQYIKFKGHDLLGTGSVVHDPDCNCRLVKDSIYYNKRGL